MQSCIFKHDFAYPGHHISLKCLEVVCFNKKDQQNILTHLLACLSYSHNFSIICSWAVIIMSCARCGFTNITFSYSYISLTPTPTHVNSSSKSPLKVNNEKHPRSMLNNLSCFHTSQCLHFSLKRMLYVILVTLRSVNDDG